MTVISAGIVNKQGRIILARQFSEISRIRVEGLLSAFPRLLDSSVNKQVTYIDAGTIRYVYQPLEDLFLVLVTTKNSNIVEDLATLHLMGRIIPEYLPEGIQEATLEEKSFVIFFALDEIVVGGKREHTTVDEIHTYLEMDSHEERVALAKKKQQLENAKRITAERARELRERRRDAAFGNGPAVGGGGAYGGIGSDDSWNVGATGASRPGQGGGDPAYNAYIAPSQQAPAPVAAAAAARPSGMSLGKGRKVDLMSKVQKEVGGTPPPRPQQQQQQQQQLQQHSAAESTEGVHATVEEKITGTIGREGDSGPIDVKGELSVLVSDPQLDQVRLALAPVSDAFQFRAHAKVNKALFASDHILAMADGKPFPVQQPVTILRWRLSEVGSIQAPISFTCWPEMGSITIEYELSQTAAPPLEPVTLTIPLYGASVAAVTPSTGSAETRNDHVLWTIPVVDGARNTSGNIEIQLGDDEEPDNVFFPIEVSFTSVVSVGMVRVNEVVRTDDGMPVRFSQETRLITDKFSIA